MLVTSIVNSYLPVRKPGAGLVSYPFMTPLTRKWLLRKSMADMIRQKARLDPKPLIAKRDGSIGKIFA